MFATVPVVPVIVMGTSIVANIFLNLDKWQMEHKKNALIV
ncbi:hypothetical protein LTSERUB_6055 [Salmonella enterica subsp. enterica serovar Rubislaw str. A4-653]|uniref:Uncharacterized protein n=1 Tax=Salmonella enterica subsp. enterica serovar Rubislaw str. A4-653 TaxID=913081 RepID=G5QS90_SALRU|nr:hypothetical protein LTSERUB_6055 [Salmonella enterica subsp. enterica serovar Rubislaw str. A4-653]